MVTEEGLANKMKSWTATLNVTVCVSKPLVAVTVTEYVPTEPLHDKVEVPVVPRVTLVLLKLHVRPVAETWDERLTVPVKPYREFTVIVELPDDAARKVILVGLAAT